jgi:hypothetical protein
MSSTAFLQNRGSSVYVLPTHKQPSPNGSGIVRLLASKTSYVAIKNVRAGNKENGSVCNTGEFPPALAYIRRPSPIGDDGS